MKIEYSYIIVIRITIVVSSKNGIMILILIQKIIMIFQFVY
nr:MAG TPA: hypothetical protein [Crassvirales sp.]